MNTSITPDFQAIISQKKNELIAKIKRNNPGANIDKIEKAFKMAYQAHRTQFRASKEPYIIHPVAVADILADLKLDTNTIITALLHDTVEDTELSIDDIEKAFGKKVANLVDGVTKLAKIKYQPDRTKQAENFRKLLLAISSDIRVLLVKLADRLHNMRTLHHIPKSEKRLRIAHETMEIYAPLAERMGIHVFKNELQDLAFAQMHPEIQSSIKKRLEFLRYDGKSLVDVISEELKKTLDAEKIQATVQGREKTSCSIWRKMEKKKVAFEQLVDIVAFRIIVDRIPECYQVLGVVHSKYHMLPNGFCDYISTPKQNSYQSLHTIVMGPENRCIEIQIRTREMHEIAEIGIAAHWIYKQGAKSMEGKQYQWINKLVEMIENTSCPEEFLENTKLEMVYDQVFCFTPKGDLIAIPSGSTPVDFAFAVNSYIGLRCIGAKINSHIAPLHTPLRNGDQIEIITSENPNPSESWEEFIITGKAKSEIRRYIRAKKHDEYVNLGKAIILNNLEKIGKKYQEPKIKRILKKVGKRTIEELLADVGSGAIEKSRVINALYPNEEKLKDNKVIPFSTFNKKNQDNHESPLPITGLVPGMAIQFANCCHPIPGDKIVGIVNTGEGVAIHAIDCNALKSLSIFSDRWVNVSWADTNNLTYTSTIKVLVLNAFGMLANVINVIAEEEVNISNIKVSNRKEDFFEFIISLEVNDTTQLHSVMDAIQDCEGVHDMHRYMRE